MGTIESSIKRFIESHYRNLKVEEIGFVGDILTLRLSGGAETHPLIYECNPGLALRILNKYPSVGMVHFTGGWIDGVFSRNTLRRAGYEPKKHSKFSEK